MVYFVTENKAKFDNANIVLEAYNIKLKTYPLPLTEIQSESLEEIAIHKAKQAFAQLHEPLVVKDDGWYITALNGFPGSYMKYVNQWLSIDDFLHLVAPYKNKEIIFSDALCYIDDNHIKTFTHSIKGRIVATPKGKGVPSAMLSTFRKDGKTMAECINEGIHFTDTVSVWNTFAKWFRKIST